MLTIVCITIDMSLNQKCIIWQWLTWLTGKQTVMGLYCNIFIIANFVNLQSFLTTWIPLYSFLCNITVLFSIWSNIGTHFNQHQGSNLSGIISQNGLNGVKTSVAAMPLYSNHTILCEINMFARESTLNMNRCWYTLWADSPAAWRNRNPSSMIEIETDFTLKHGFAKIWP